MEKIQGRRALRGRTAWLLQAVKITLLFVLGPLKVCPALPTALTDVCQLYRRWLRSQDKLRCECTATVRVNSSIYVAREGARSRSSPRPLTPLPRRGGGDRGSFCGCPLECPLLPPSRRPSRCAVRSGARRTARCSCVCSTGEFTTKGEPPISHTRGRDPAGSLSPQYKSGHVGRDRGSLPY